MHLNLSVKFLNLFYQDLIAYAEYFKNLQTLEITFSVNLDFKIKLN